MSMLPAYPWLDQSQCFDDTVFDSGWNELIRDLLRQIDAILSGHGAVLRVYQIKEKFGSLRFYYDLHGATHAQEQAISDARRTGHDRSKLTCFECGAPGRIRNTSGRIIPTCDRHATP